MNYIGMDSNSDGGKRLDDRRLSDRFPIEREIRFKTLGKREGNHSGAGTTLNISSRGILFSTDQVLLPGKKIEMAVSWPAQLDDHCPLKLVARGRVIRCEAGQVAVKIEQYEFRTLGPHGLTV